jgi:multidrug resistance efflux pump
METILLAIYAIIVWLVFFKFKWLPWNIYSQVTVFMLPIIALTAMILFLNVVAPSSHDVRVINYSVDIIPQVRGRVIDVPIEPNRHVKKGEVLFRIDPTNFELEVKSLEAKLPAAQAEVARMIAYEKELKAQLDAAQSGNDEVATKLALARERQRQTRELADAGAGSVFEAERAEANVKNLEAQLESSRAAGLQIEQKLSARTEDGTLADIARARSDVAQLEAQIVEARWRLDQTTVYAPSDGRAVNLQLRAGAFTVPFPIAPVMTFVEDEQWVIAFFGQNELRRVQDDDEAEIYFHTYPNRIIKCRVDSIIWASGQGQLPIAGMIPDEHAPPNRFPVRLLPEDPDLFLAAGARGGGAIYTQSGHMFHILRKVLLRVSTKFDWFILKLH